MTGRRGGDSNMAAVLELVQRNRDDAVDGHKRLRTDWRGHDHRLENLETLTQTLTQAVTELRGKVAQPQDISVSTLPIRFVAPIVIAGLLAAGAMWRTGSRVDDLAVQMTNRAKLDDERHEGYKSSLDELRKEVKLYELKTESVERALISKGVIR